MFSVALTAEGVDGRKRDKIKVNKWASRIVSPGMVIGSDAGERPALFFALTCNSSSIYRRTGFNCVA